jgi:hypothetical protein
MPDSGQAFFLFIFKEFMLVICIFAQVLNPDHIINRIYYRIVS